MFHSFLGSHCGGPGCRARAEGNKRVGLEEMTFILVEERTEIVGCGYVVYESRWKRYQLRTGACWALGAL